MYLTWLSSLAELLPKIAIIFGLGILFASLTWLIVRVTRFIRMMKTDISCLEVTPPSTSERSLNATTQLFTALYGLGTVHSFFEKIFQPPSSFVLEIDSTKAGGIRYLIYCPKDKLPSLERLIHAYVPEAKLQRISVPEKVTHLHRKTISFRQKRHYAFPLKSLDYQDSHDPVSYLASAMANPSAGEHLSFQLVIRPMFSREAESIASKILDNEDLLSRLQNRRVNASGVFNIINKFLFGILDVISSVTAPESKHEYMMSKRDIEYKKQVAKRLKPVRTLSYFEHELVESIHRKLSEPLFSADIRISIATEDKNTLKERLKNVRSAISLFNVPKYQQLTQNKVQDKLKKRWLEYKQQRRLPSISRKSIFSSAELAGLYHFPNNRSGKTDNVITSLSKTLPAPVALKNGTSLGITIGKNVHHGISTPIGLTDDERQRHVYIIGGTGNGKTTMLQYAIVQDIKAGKGVAVLDPHGDLANTILHHIPENRIKDVIYVNPDDLTHPIGVNLLELAPGLSGDDLLREKDIITESAISVMRKIFSDDDSGGHRIEYVLRNAIQTALTLEAPTLFTIFELLNDAKFRRSVVRELKDEHLKNFWKNELGKAGEFQRVKMAAGITAKIGRFLFSASARRVLEQEKSTVDFDDILVSKKILICNFSKGLLGEDTSTLFGTTMLAKLQVASLRRARLQQTDRTPYYLYVDEFQNFATMSFVQMLSEARKYKLFLTMAEQSTSQQDQQRLVDIILANVGTVICFRSGSPTDERYILPLFSPLVQQGEIANLPAYNFYARIAAVQAQEPMSGMTVLLENAGNNEIAQRVVASSQELYAKKLETPKPVKVAKKDPPKSESQPKQRKKTQATKNGFNELDASPEVA